MRRWGPLTAVLVALLTELTLSTPALKKPTHVRVLPSILATLAGAFGFWPSRRGRLALP